MQHPDTEASIANIEVEVEATALATSRANIGTSNRTRIAHID